MIRTQVLKAILAAYQSLEAPQFHFVEARLRAGAYQDLVDEISRADAIEERTDPNTDVSRVFEVGEPPSGTLQLSLVGPYGVYFRHSRSDGELFATSLDTANTLLERRIVEACQRHKIELLDEKSISQPIRLKLFDTAPDRVRIYQALFSDVDFIPGEYAG